LPSYPNQSQIGCGWFWGTASKKKFPLGLDRLDTPSGPGPEEKKKFPYRLFANQNLVVGRLGNSSHFTFSLPYQLDPGFDYLSKSFRKHQPLRPLLPRTFLAIHSSYLTVSPHTALLTPPHPTSHLGAAQVQRQPHQRRRPQNGHCAPAWSVVSLNLRARNIAFHPVTKIHDAIAPMQDLFSIFSPCRYDLIIFRRTD
jgi:hypothetical protein